MRQTAIVTTLALLLAEVDPFPIPFIRSRHAAMIRSSFPISSRPLRSSFDDDDYDYVYTANLPGEEDLPITREDISTMTVPQLKQQLRLRGLKVGGLKSDLMDRLFQFTAGTVMPSAVQPTPTPTPKQEDDSTTTTNAGNKPVVVDAVFTKAVQFAQDRGKELVDVTDFLEPQDADKTTRSIQNKEPEQTPDTVNTGGGPETWGSEARVVDDYEGRSVVVDSLSRTVLEYKGSNQTFVQAFVVASRDALQGFLAGGGRARNTTQVASSAEARLYEIQSKREQASRNPIRQDQEEGLDEGDEPGLYKQVMHRDHSDWGKYTQTGAQLSSQEVQGILLLSDVYGAFTNDTRILAEKIAFECQPVVVMVPDLFRGAPWDGPTTGKNSKGQTYEQWRARQDDVRVSVDIRAAAACLRDQYGVSSVVVWGTCFGGGKALEAAAGYHRRSIPWSVSRGTQRDTMPAHSLERCIKEHWPTWMGTIEMWP
jgi:SAP domain/Dienelactone hydrolase family